MDEKRRDTASLLLMMLLIVSATAGLLRGLKVENARQEKIPAHHKEPLTISHQFTNNTSKTKKTCA